MVFRELPQRSEQKEILDAPVHDQKLFEDAISYLRWSNRWLGNNLLIAWHVKRLLHSRARWQPQQQRHPHPHSSQTLRMIDIGTGVADVPLLLARKFQHWGVLAQIIGTDNNPAVIRVARKRIASYSNITLIESDHIPSEHAPYDIAILSQMVHHLTPREALTLFRELAELHTGAVIISDLYRSRLAYWLVRIVTFLTSRNAIVHVDGPQSVLRAYSDKEIGILLKNAGFSRFRIFHYFPRKVIIAER